MSYQPLHHKYRPQTFAGLVGQEAIAATLTNAIQQQRIAPAYLFTGARGTGKTSSARILAKSLNCIQFEQPTPSPCGRCEVCRAISAGVALDVIEIDAASNTGVDNIRELIERAQFAPVQCRYKVYVIDEVHMLSNAAFNALLKTLEEPPDRVVFVLATTDPQRVLPTIISRCQRFDFRRIPLESMAAHLRTISDKESIAITDDAITLVAQISQGGLRDAESLLDQLSLLTGEVTVEKVWDLVGSVPERDLMSLLQAIAADHPETLLDSTRRLMDRGREPLIVLQNLASFYRDLLIARTAPDRGDLVSLTQSTWTKLCEFAQALDTSTILAGQQHLRSAELQLKGTTQPRLWLEVTLMGLLPSAIATQQTPNGGQAVATRQPRATTHNGQSVTSPATSSIAPATLKPSVAPPLVTPTSSAATPPATPPPPMPPKADPDLEPEEVETSIPQESSIADAEPATAQGTEKNLQQIWQQIIANLHPLSKALLNEHGQLLGFDGQEVRIGIGNDKLVKIAQGKLKDIEQAFVEVFKQKVRVSLEVATLTAPNQRGTAADAVPEGAPPAQGEPPRRTINPDRNQPPSRSPNPDRTNSGPTPPPAKPSSEPRSAAEAKPTAAKGKGEVQPTESTQPVTHPWEEDESARAARQLAEFFAGKVVNLSDEEDLPATSAEATEVPIDFAEPASDEEDNVPF